MLIKAVEILRDSHEARLVELEVEKCEEGKNYQLQPVLDYMGPKTVKYSFLHIGGRDYNISKEDYMYLVERKNVKLVKK